MRDYIIGSILTLATAIIIQMFGCCIANEKRTYSYKFVIGYLIYSFFVAIAGITVQIFKLSWYVFFWYMNILIVGILLFIIYNFLKKRIIFNLNVIREYIKQNWFLYVGAILLIGFAVTHISIIWLNNMSDDAYYLNKMASLPYLKYPFNTDYTTGFYSKNTNFAYSLSAFEIEASYFIYITKMNAALYARGFLALFNYFVLLNAIHAFILKLSIKLKSINKYNMQYFSVTLFVIFVCCASLYIKANDGSASDACWAILSAAYFGSSFIRVGCIFIVLLPLLELEELNARAVLLTIISCVVMISKSSCSLPILFMLACGYMFTNYFLCNDFKHFSIIVIGFLVLFIIGILFANNQNIEKYTYDLILYNLRSPLNIIAIVIFILLAFRNKFHFKLFLITLVAYLLMLIPQLNDIFETLSGYDFVVGRLFYSWMIFIQIVSIGFLFLMGYDKFGAKIKIGILNGVISIGVILTLFITGTDWTMPKLTLSIIKDNKYLIPASTVLLGDALEEYYIDTGITLKMIMTPGVTVNECGHFPSQIIRSISPHTISVTGALRVDNVIKDKDSEFYGYDVKDAEKLNNLITNPTDENLQKIGNLCSKYPINCIVCNNNSELVDEQLKKIGFKKYKTIVDEQQDTVIITYNIFIKD